MKRFRKSIVLLLAVFTICLMPVTAWAKTPSLNKTKVTLSAGETCRLKTKNLKAGKVLWSSSNKAVASVSSKGKVKAKKNGTAVISAKAGATVLTCTVKVRTKLVPMKKLKRYGYFLNYMSEKQMRKTYKAAAKILKPLLGLSKKEQVIGIMQNMRRLVDAGIKYSMSAKHYNDPYGFFVKKCASCAGCARAAGFCLNMLGYKYEHVNENQYSHQWARVKVGGKYWICDAYGLYAGPEPAKRKHPYLS